jgi:thiamine-phosphate pyrophosphorylase
VIPRLLYITDGERGTAGRALRTVIESACSAGLPAILLRSLPAEDADAAALIESLAPLRAAGLRVLASRRLDLARAYALDGVQLAADAVPIAEARRWLGPQTLIGYSAHDGPEARAAERAGADYVTLSPVYATGSKPGAAGRGPAWLAEQIHGLGIPVLALGGVTPERAPEVLGAGAWGIAAVSAIGAAADVAQAARHFLQTITERTR